MNEYKSIYLSYLWGHSKTKDQQRSLYKYLKSDPFLKELHKRFKRDKELFRKEKSRLRRELHRSEKEEGVKLKKLLNNIQWETIVFSDNHGGHYTERKPYGSVHKGCIHRRRVRRLTTR